MPHYTEGRHHFLCQHASTIGCQRDAFEPSFWQSSGHLQPTAQGRGSAWFFNHQAEAYVLRHYRRGGKIAPLLHDRFLYTGLSRTRPWREWHLLNQLHQQGLPVPRPIAAHIHHRGLYYYGDIILQRILSCHTLAEHLSNGSLKTPQWQLIGQTIARFHQNGVYHADLNAHNILLDQAGKVWLIDFDNAGYRPITMQWPQQNLQRLRRSLCKIHHPANPFPTNGWEALYTEYTQTMGVEAARV